MDETEERPSKLRKIAPPSPLHQQDLDYSSLPGEDFQNGIINENDTDKNNSKEEEALLDPELRFSPEIEISEPPLSKNQRKKLLKKERWEAGRDGRREKRKDKVKKKQQLKLKQLLDAAALVSESKSKEQHQPAISKSRSIQLPITFIIDCDFEKYMQPKEIISLASQVTRCYSENRFAKYKTHLVISSWGGLLKERFETVLANNHLGWKNVKFIREDFITAAEKMSAVMKEENGGKLAAALALDRNDQEENKDPVERNENNLKETDADQESHLPPIKIVYLSSDSPNNLTHLSPNTSYVIGGLVDKNREKGLCHRRAHEYAQNLGSKNIDVTTARLPISQFMSIQGRSVLAVNHVIEIMLSWLENGDWEKAFLERIPKRKGAAPKQGGAKREPRVEVEDGNDREKDGEKDGEKDAEGDGEGNRESEAGIAATEKVGHIDNDTSMNL